MRLADLKVLLRADVIRRPAEMAHSYKEISFQNIKRRQDVRAEPNPCASLHLWTQWIAKGQHAPLTLVDLDLDLGMA